MSSIASRPESGPVPSGFSWDGINMPVIKAKGFREYDGRWLFPGEINLLGAERLGQSLGTLMHEREIAPKIILGRDFRSYSQPVANALTLGLMSAGIQVLDIGTVISPMAYFSRVHLGIGAVAMVTASHNPNGWTGLKAGFRHPLTLGGREMLRLREIAQEGRTVTLPSGSHSRVGGIAKAYADDLCQGPALRRRLRIVCASGNGTAGRYAPGILRRAGTEVIPLHTEPDCSFPNYNPNPESVEMLEDMGRCVRSSGADLGFGFDGDGDRLGVVDDRGRAVFSDKVGLLLARSISRRLPNAHFIADVKSTGLFAADPLLKERGIQTEYWKTGHSHMKLRLEETGAAAGFEKSGHFYFGPPIGRGYDDALLAALEILRMLDRAPGRSLSDLADSLPKSWMTPTMSPFCSDEEKYAAVSRITARLETLAGQGGSLGGQRIAGVSKINGARCVLSNGSWALVRASSNTPNLVVVCESMESEREMRAIFEDVDRLIRQEESVGEYDQRI